MSAQISGNHRSQRGIVGSSSAEAVHLHPSLRETLAAFSLPASTTIRQLYHLLLALDHECLQHATDHALTSAHDSISEVEPTVELVMFLSGPLSQSGYPGTFMFQEIQLRALISSLALLQHSGVHTLDADVYERLRLKNISARYQKIAFQINRSSALADRIRGASNMYLVQLASQYVSFINRGDSPWPSIFGPTMDIFFSALSLGGGQYGSLQKIIGSLNQLFNIWQRPQTKYQALCGLQEYTRSATSLCREATIADESGELRTAATAIVTALIDKVDEILAVENKGFPPELATRWQKSLASISRGPPDLNQGYYYYGLLDIVSQLATVSDRQMLGKGLLKKIVDLVFESVVPEFRWKAVEILLSCRCTREEHHRILESDIERRVSVETKAKIREETRLIQAHLENDEGEGLRLQMAQPLTRISPIISSDPVNPPIEEIANSNPEGAFPRSIIKKSTAYSLRSVRKFGSSYNSAGLFEDCKHAFFNNDSNLSVYKLGDLRSQPTSPSFSWIFTQKYKHKERIRSVASSKSGIVLITNERQIIFNIQAKVAESPVGSSLHGVWDPSGVACHESETHFVVFLGQCRRNESNGYNGQIRVYKYRKDGQAQEFPIFIFPIPANDCPKKVFFHAGSQILICITRLQNKLLVWRLDEGFSSTQEPFDLFQSGYTAETGETGLTSATVYQSPSNRLYVLCTTAPSTERFRHGGEWSFILLIPPNRSRPPLHRASNIHTFEQLSNHRPLFVGSSSNQHHVFAVLENSGRLSFLRLQKHDDGGIYSKEDAEALPHALCKQDGPLTGCLRFDPTGSYLFALDPKGKIIVTEFEKQRAPEVL